MFARLKHPGLPQFLGLATLGLAMSYALAGPPAAMGFALGAGSGAFNMVALWGAISLMGRAYRTDATEQTDRSAPQRGGGAFLAGAFLLKLPVYVLAFVVAQRVGGAAPDACLAAIGMVYFGLLWWALTRG